MQYYKRTHLWHAMLVSSAPCTIYENHCLETHLRVWYWLFLLLWWWLVSLLWWCSSFLKNIRKSITLHQKLQLSVHDTEGTSRTCFFLWHHLKYILLPALCSHMDWTPALHAADLGFNLSQETGYKHWGFFVIFLRPSMQISENCLKLNYKGQKQTMRLTYVNVWLVSSSQWSLRYHHIKKI